MTTGTPSTLPSPGARAAGPALLAALVLVAVPVALRGQAPGGGDASPAATAEGAAAEGADRRSSTLLRGAVEGLLPDSLRTEVLVLGSTHLSRYADRFRPGLLDDLVGTLEAWGPEAVGVERDPPEVHARIGADPEPGVSREMQEWLGVGLDRAVAVSDSLLDRAEAGEALVDDDRLALVRHLVAADRLPTATLHWTRLPVETRAEADLPEQAREALEARADGPANEIYSVGLRLARERGLEQVYPIDDATSERVFDLERAAAEGGLGERLAGHPTYEPLADYMGEDRRRVAEAIEGGDLMPYYRWKNDPATVARDVRLQWGIFLELAPELPLAQKRIAHWEVRNLKMATHIRKMTLHHPGERILVVVGAGHKAFFDAYLEQMLDVEVVQLDQLLADDEAGGSSGDGRPGGTADPGGADASHYRIEARIEPGTGRVDAELDMRWVPEQPTDTLRFFLHRDLGRPAVEGDAVADVRVEPERRFAEAFDSDTSHTNRVTVALEETATPEEPVELRWRYGGTLATDRIRLGGSAVTPHWVELEVGSLWVPAGASLRERFTFDAEVELPEGFTMVSSGPVERNGTTHRVRSTVLNPDVPVIASDRFETLRRDGEGPSVTVHHAGAADSVVTFMADHAERLLARYDERFESGRNLESLRITIPPVPRARPELYARPGLIAMSHGSGNRTDDSAYELLAHESAHLWWTDAADTQSRHNFLNESFAEYEAALALREAYGEEAFAERIGEAREAAAELPGLDAWTPQLNDPLTRQKGPWLLHRLHERIGEDAYLRFVRALQRKSVGTLEEMIRVLGETSDAGTARWFEGELFS